MRHSSRLLLLMFLSLTSFAMCQETKKTAVVFDCNCSDTVAAQYATAVRDLLATSPRYYLASIAEEKGKDGKISAYHWHLKVVSVDPSTGNDGRSTALSIVLLLGDSFYMTQEVQTCGANKVSSCASSTVSFMDGYLNSN